MTTCPCGIARVDCEYHRPEPEPEPVHDDEWVSTTVTTDWIAPWAGNAEKTRLLVRGGTGKCLTPCGHYVETWDDGELVDEEPAEAYKDHTIDAMVQSYKGIVIEPVEAYSFRNSMGCIVSFFSVADATDWIRAQPFPLEWRAYK